MRVPARNSCDAPFTVCHSLLECGDFAQVRNKCFRVNIMKQLFQDTNIGYIMTFKKKIFLTKFNVFVFRNPSLFYICISS